MGGTHQCHFWCLLDAGKHCHIHQLQLNNHDCVSWPLLLFKNVKKSYLSCGIRLLSSLWIGAMVVVVGWQAHADCLGWSDGMFWEFYTSLLLSLSSYSRAEFINSAFALCRYDYGMSNLMWVWGWWEATLEAWSHYVLTLLMRVSRYFHFGVS